MPLCRRCEHVVVKDCELYCGRQCAGAAVGDARWRSLPPTYLAKRILPADEGKHLKGLFGCGPTPMDVPVGAIVVDADTGEFNS